MILLAKDAAMTPAESWLALAVVALLLWRVVRLEKRVKLLELATRQPRPRD
jgi:hypothetical protein